MGTSELSKSARDQALPPEPGVHRHDEEKVDILKHALQHVEGSGKVEGHARFRPQLTNEGQNTLEMHGRFLMNDHELGANLDEPL